jgi:hypothetical protein
VSLTPPLVQIRVVLEHAVPAEGVNASAFSRRRGALLRAAEGDGDISTDAMTKLLDDAACGADGPVARVSWNFSSWWVREWITRSARPTDDALLAGIDLFAEAGQ